MFSLLLLLAPVLQMILVSPAASAAAGYYCGDGCNGKLSSYTIPSNGVTCSHSASTVGSGYPSTAYAFATPKNPEGMKYETDTDIHVVDYYSSTCQTMWAVVTNSSSPETRSGCYIQLQRTISKTWTSPQYGCPAIGKTSGPIMVNDYSPSNGKAATFTLSFSKIRQVCYYNEVCSNEGVYFTYNFSY